jgi:hypothetical protein
MCRPECAKSDGGAVKGVWRREVYGGGAWQVSGGRGRPVVPGLHGVGYPDRRAEDIRSAVLMLVHGSRMVGYFGVLRTAARL